MHAVFTPFREFILILDGLLKLYFSLQCSSQIWTAYPNRLSSHRGKFVESCQLAGKKDVHLVLSNQLNVWEGNFFRFVCVSVLGNVTALKVYTTQFSFLSLSN